LDLKIGDIVLIDFPYTNRSGSKYRPSLVLHIDNFNQDLLIGYMTTEVDTYVFDENVIFIENHDLVEGVLTRNGWVSNKLCPL